MEISRAGIDFIKVVEEGDINRLDDVPPPRLHAYDDGVGVWTIGWGCTEGVRQGDTITIERAEEMFAEELAKFVDAVNKLVTVPINQGQFDVLVSFAYNVGIGALGKSTLLRKLNAGDYGAVPGELVKWCHGGGRVMPGLLARRKIEGARWKAASCSQVSNPLEGKQKVNILSIIGAIASIIPSLSHKQDDTPAAAAGAKIAPGAANTNILSIVIGAIMAGVGATGFGVDAVHTVAALAGIGVSILSAISHAGLISASNASTEMLVEQILAQVASYKAGGEGGSATDH